jgi:hypothetical protein
MSDETPAVRIAACRAKSSADGMTWELHLFNDTLAPLEDLVLIHVEWEWGDESRYERLKRSLGRLNPGTNLLIHRDDGEFRLTVRIATRIVHDAWEMEFEFPKLYMQRHLQPIPELGELGIEGVRRMYKSAASK